MMRSESTSAFGHPRLTKPTRGARRGGSARACSAMTPVLAHETNGCGGSCYRVAGVPSALTGGSAQPPAHHAVPGRWCARMSAKNTNSTTSGMTSHGQMAGRRSPRILRRSAAIDSHELRLAERLCVHAEADVGRGRIRRHVQARDFERVEPEVVVMRLARRRTRAAVAGCAEISAGLYRAGGHQLLVRIAG